MKNTHSEPLSLEHQSLLSTLWKLLCHEHDLQFAEYSFANAFLFRRRHAYRVILGETPLVFGRFFPLGDGSFLIPTRYPAGTVLKEPLCFFPIPQHCLHLFPSTRYRACFSRDDSDYLFKIEKLRSLAGRALSSRRNLLHQLESQHHLEARNLTDDELSQARTVLELWQEESGLAKESTDYLACVDALTYKNQLSLFGRIVYADGEPVGFTIGELLTPSTALLHIMKVAHRLKGLTPFLTRDFALQLPDSVRWINLEEDLGLPGLRQAKNAYDPDLLLSKWRVYHHVQKSPDPIAIPS